MNIGSLYLVKKYFWLLFPSKETAATANIYAHDIAVGYADARANGHARVVATAEYVVAYWSERLKCEVTYFSPNEYIVFLKKEGKYKKVKTSDGKIGWIWFEENYNDCFEEVKTE